MKVSLNVRRHGVGMLWGVAIAAVLQIAAAQSALAQATPTYHPKVVQQVKQPQGKNTKVSSFAPHPTKQRVFGDPIQAPIVGHVQPKKKPPN